MTCVIAKDCKTADEVADGGFDYSPDLVVNWAAGTIFAEGDSIRPTDPTGFQYIASGNGQSGDCEPFWPQYLGGTVRDGSLLWTATAIGNESLRTTIDTSVWAEATSTITISNDVIVNTDGKQATAAMFAGGVSGETYDIVNTVTMLDGSVEVATLRLRIS